jgi:FkbM family methyltransferase
MPAQTIRLPATDNFNALVLCRHGAMLDNRNDPYVGASLRVYGEYSRTEAEILRRLVQPGMVIVEAGANIGAHTVLLSQLTGPGGAVIAFEPQRIVFQTMCANLALNGCANVHALQGAVGETSGEILVPLLAPDQPHDFAGVSLIGVQQGEKVSMWALDKLELPACHVIKLDIEGMELDALRGGAGLVRKYRPALYVANNRPNRAAQVVGLLLGWKYRLYQHRSPLYPGPDNFAGVTENIFGGLVSSNLLCLPAELNATVKGLEEIEPATAK